MAGLGFGGLLVAQSFQVGVEHAHRHFRCLSPIGPELLAVEANIEGALPRGGQTMPVRIRVGVGGRDAHDHALLAADVARHSDVAAHEFVLDPNPVTQADVRQFGRRLTAGPAGARQAEVEAGRAAQGFSGAHTALHAKAGHGGEGALVVGGGHVVAWLHALDRMPVFVHVVDAVADQAHPHGRDADVGFAVEGLGVALAHHGAEALAAAEIMNAVHGGDPRLRESMEPSQMGPQMGPQRAPRTAPPAATRRSGTPG